MTDLLTLRVEKLLWRGRGLARLDSGQVVMLEPGVLPGEEIQARVLKQGRDFIQAEAVTISTPSPDRISHPCPHAGECGGSRFGILDPARGTAIKADMLRDAVSRALGRDTSAQILDSLKILPSPLGWRYRWRGQIHVLHQIPHAMAHASNDLVPLTDCHLLAAPLAASMQRLAQKLPDGRHTIAASPDTGDVLSEHDAGKLQFSLPEFGLTMHLPPDTFFQANWALNQILIHEATHSLGGYTRIADLFSGAGNFALPLASQNKTVLAVEGSRRAARVGADNAQRLGLPTVNFKAADLSKPLSWNMVRDFAPEAAILDPPRTGAKGIGEVLSKLPSLSRLTWVSCDVVNTLRDARPLLDQGWTIAAMTLLDMFPGTWHMEVLMILDHP